MAGRAASVVKFVEQCSLSESLEVSNYLKAIECLRSMQFGFKDVQMVLFKPKLNVLLNLVGLHYCLNCLQEPVTFPFCSSLLFVLFRLKYMFLLSLLNVKTVKTIFF